MENILKTKSVAHYFLLEKNQLDPVAFSCYHPEKGRKLTIY